jgi:hypothetical protein
MKMTAVVTIAILYRGGVSGTCPCPLGFLNVNGVNQNSIPVSFSIFPSSSVSFLPFSIHLGMLTWWTCSYRKAFTCFIIFMSLSPFGYVSLLLLFHNICQQNIICIQATRIIDPMQLKSCISFLHHDLTFFHQMSIYTKDHLAQS